MEGTGEEGKPPDKVGNHPEPQSLKDEPQSIIGKSNAPVSDGKYRTIGPMDNAIARLQLSSGMRKSQSMADLRQVEPDNGLEQLNATDKRVRSPGENELGAKRTKIGTMVCPFTKMGEKIKELSSLSTTHTTCPRTIKTAIIALKSIFEDAAKEYAQAKDEARALTTLLSTHKPDVLTTIRNKITTEMTMDQTLDLARQEWPPEAFRTTTLAQKDLDGKTGLKSTLVFPGSFLEDSNFRKLANIVPELQGVTVDLFKKVGTIEVKRKEQVLITGLEAASAEKVYQLHPALISTNKQIEFGDVKSWAMAIQRACAEMDNRNVEIFLPDGIDVTLVRKILECALVNTPIKVLVRISRQQRRLYQEQHRTVNETIIIHKVEGVSYSEVVKDLKNSINPEEVGIQINKVTETEKGHVRIQIRETRTGAKKMMLDQISQVKSAKSAFNVQRTKGIVIFDIDPDVDANEVKEILKEELKIDAEQIRMNPLRETKRGTMMLSVFLPENIAREAIQMKKIKIGWTMCQIKERVEVPHCMNCSKVGHTKRECKEETCPEKCLRCGDEHQTKTCTSDKEYCISCGEAGHRANAFKCPVYKNVINATRK